MNFLDFASQFTKDLYKDLAGFSVGSGGTRGQHFNRRYFENGATAAKSALTRLNNASKDTKFKI